MTMPRLVVEVVQVAPGPRGEECGADPADRSLDASFLIAAVGSDRLHLEAVVVGEVDVERMVLDRRADTPQDDTLEIVGQDPARYGMEALECLAVARQKARETCVEEEVQEEVPRPRQHHDESHQRTLGPANDPGELRGPARRPD